MQNPLFTDEQFLSLHFLAARKQSPLHKNNEKRPPNAEPSDKTHGRTQ
jgi:hypothetical protein